MNGYGDSVTRLRAPLVDGYGGQRVRDWANAVRVDVAASVQTIRVTEDDTDRQVTTTDKRMFTADEFTETDRVEWRGSLYEVGGVEEHLMQGRFDHYEVTLERVAEAST